jgi:hypothetical protein
MKNECYDGCCRLPSCFAISHSKCREIKPNYKVIVSDPAVILYVDGKKYVAKCHPEDTFNPLIGLMMCFTKACGMNYHRLSKLLAEATVYNTTVETPVASPETIVSETPIEPTSEALFIIKSIKGRSKDKYVTDYDAKDLKVKYGEVPFTFATEKRALAFCEKYALEDKVIIEEISISEVEECVQED